MTVQQLDEIFAPSFADRFAEMRRIFGPLVFGLDPSGAVLESWGLEDTADGVERFVDIVVEAAAGTVGLVKPQSAFYERHGWKGVRALSRLVAECRSAGLLVVLDAKRGDVGSTNVAYGEAYLGEDAGIPVDALTVNPFLGLTAMRTILDRAAAAGSAVFIVTRSSNPEGRLLQEAVTSHGLSVGQALLSGIAAENARLTSKEIGPVGAVVGITAEVPHGLDLGAMRGLFLAPGLGAQGGTINALITCFHSCQDRVLPSASRSLLDAGPGVSALREAAFELAAQVRIGLDGVGVQ